MADPSPEKTVPCAGCRQAGRPLDLERFVHHESVGLMHDMRRGAPGDEAFAHPQPGCLNAAAWGGFARMLGRRLPDLEAEDLVENVRSNVEARLLERLREAARHDSLLIGPSAMRRSWESVELVLRASDADLEDSFIDEARDRDLPVFEALEEAQLSDIVGAESLSVVAAASEERAEAVGRDLEKLLCLDFDES